VTAAQTDRQSQLDDGGAQRHAVVVKSAAYLAQPRRLDITGIRLQCRNDGTNDRDLEDAIGLVDENHLMSSPDQSVGQFGKLVVDVLRSERPFHLTIEFGQIR